MVPAGAGTHLWNQRIKDLKNDGVEHHQSGGQRNEQRSARMPLPADDRDDETNRAGGQHRSAVENAQQSVPDKRFVERHLFVCGCARFDDDGQMNSCRQWDYSLPDLIFSFLATPPVTFAGQFFFTSARISATTVANFGSLERS